MDVLTRKTRRRAGADEDEDSDDGPPPDPDEPAPAPVPKKEKKPTAEAKEVQVAVRRSDDKSMQLGGGLTAMRREMLMAIRAEEDESWEDLQYFENGVRTLICLPKSCIDLVVQTQESNEVLEKIFSQHDDVLECKTDVTDVLKSIKGLT